MADFVLLGAGKMGGLYADRICAEGHNLVAIFDPRSEQLHDARSRWDTRGTTRLDSIPHDVDAIVVAAPALWHEPLTLWALQHADRVLVEKPMALSFSAAERMRSLARDLGKVLYSGFTLLFDPITEKLDNAIEVGGDPQDVTVHWSSTAVHPEGPLWDLGPHPLSVIRFLYGVNYHIRDAWTLPGGVGFRLEYANGMLVKVILSNTPNAAGRRIRAHHYQTQALADYGLRRYNAMDVKLGLVDPITNLLRSFLGVAGLAEVMLNEGVEIVHNLEQIQELAWRTGD